MSFGDADTPVMNGQLVTTSFIEQQTRGEVDSQIATAKRFPRSLRQFKQKALELATLDEDTARGCFYVLPRDGKNIEGPSARLAEIVAGSWGNLRSQANIVDEDDKFITARGVCWDLENNVAISVEVRRRITNKYGKKYNDDMIGTTANAACSIALRNAVFKVVPMAVCKPIYEAARKVAIGDATTLASRRAKMLDHFAKMGVRPEQVYAKVGKQGVDDITLDDLAVLIGLSTAIRDGDTSVDEEFPAVQKPNGNGNGNGHTNGNGQAQTKSDELANKIGAGGTTEATGDKPKATAAELLDAIAKATKTAEVTDLVFARQHLTEDEQKQVEQAGRLRKEEIRKAK